MNKLSPDQKKAATSEKRFLRIVAGAGAGKTTTMAMRIVYLLSQGVNPKDIVAFTFTEKSAQNMKNRIYEKVRKIDSQLCDTLGEMYIGTIHAFCYQLLEDFFGYGNHDVLDENQEIAFLMRHGWGLGLGGSGYVKNCLNFHKSVSVVYDELIDYDKLKDKAVDFHHKFTKYENMLDQEKLLTFSRIINFTVKNIEKRSESIQHIKHLMVDEYQDINKAQQELIKLIGKKASVYVVGDPRQCVYQWRGSNGEYFEDFINDFTGGEKVTIPENRRSCKIIVDNANNFSKNLQGQYDYMETIRKKVGISYKSVCEDPEKEAEKIVSEVKKLVEVKKRCNYSDIGILLRSVKTSAGPFIDKLKQNDIPFIIGGKIGLFRRDESQVAGRLFAWLHKDGFWLTDSYNWQSRIIGDKLVQSTERLWQNIFPGSQFPLDLIKEWREQVLIGSYRGLTEAYQELLLILGFLDLDQNNKQHAAIMANLGRFNKLLTDYQDSAIRKGRSFNWNNDIKGLAWFMNSYAYEAYDEQPADDLRGVDAVQIMTVHQAKGLEWLVVFIPCLVDRRFPASRIGSRQNWFIPRDMFPVDRYEGEIDDERRLFYVAITRARDYLCLSRFKMISQNKKPSIFYNQIKLKEYSKTDELPDGELETRLPEEELQTYTGSEIIEYNRCNYFYRLRHLWGFQSEFSTMLNFGKSLHHCLRLASEMVMKDKTEPERAIETVFSNDEFHLPYAGAFAKGNAEQSAKKTLKNYVKKYKKDMLNIHEVEARLEFPLENATVAGIVDVILDDQGKKEVRDYKTSFEVTTLDEVGLQIRLYSLGLNITGDVIEKASVVALKEKDGEAHIKEIGVTAKDLENAKLQAKKAIDGIKKGIWKAKVTKRCNDCDYKKICRYTNVKRKLIVDIPFARNGSNKI
ncbi:ATP-dependent helicase [archaeon AH-315-M20]|nr:ATP-dependent helicase [archaeon AH-315-M20]